MLEDIRSLNRKLPKLKISPKLYSLSRIANDAQSLRKVPAHRCDAEISRGKLLQKFSGNIHELQLGIPPGFAKFHNVSGKEHLSLSPEARFVAVPFNCTAQMEFQSGALQRRPRRFYQTGNELPQRLAANPCDVGIGIAQMQHGLSAVRARGGNVNLTASDSDRA